MPLKCAACGLVNFSDASFCKRCGSRLEASQAQQTLIAASPDGTDRKSLRPTFFFLGSMLALVAVIFVVVGIYHQVRAARCSATTQGLLEEKYTIETTKKLEIPITESYVVRYSFSVQGRNYEGSSRVSTKPVMREATIYYNPANPEENLIEPQPFSLLWTLLTLGVGVGAVAFFVLGVRQK